MKLPKVLKKIKFNWETDKVFVNGLVIRQKDSNFNLEKNDEIRITQIKKDNIIYLVTYFKKDKIEWVSPLQDYYKYN